MSAPDQPKAHFDPVALCADLGGSMAAVVKVLETVAPWLEDMRARLSGAVDAGDMPQVSALTHALRGSLAQLRARSAVERVHALEALCKADPGIPLRADHPDLLALDRELDTLAAEIAQFLTAARSAPHMAPHDPA